MPSCVDASEQPHKVLKVIPLTGRPHELKNGFAEQAGLSCTSIGAAWLDPLQSPVAEPRAGVEGGPRQQEAPKQGRPHQSGL